MSNASEGTQVCFSELYESIARNNALVFGKADEIASATDEITKGMALGPLAGVFAATLAANVAQCYSVAEEKLAQAGMKPDEINKRREELAAAVGMLAASMLKMALLGGSLIGRGEVH